jgi:hypothetical protein
MAERETNASSMIGSREKKILIQQKGYFNPMERKRAKNVSYFKEWPFIKIIACRPLSYFNRTK